MKKSLPVNVTRVAVNPSPTPSQFANFLSSRAARVFFARVSERPTEVCCCEIFSGQPIAIERQEKSSCAAE